MNPVAPVIKTLGIVLLALFSWLENSIFFHAIIISQSSNLINNISEKILYLDTLHVLISTLPCVISLIQNLGRRQIERISK